MAGFAFKVKGTAKVILTAPGKGDMKNIVSGINDDYFDDKDTIISADLYYQCDCAAIKSDR